MMNLEAKRNLTEVMTRVFSSEYKGLSMEDKGFALLLSYKGKEFYLMLQDIYVNNSGDYNTIRHYNEANIDYPITIGSFYKYEPLTIFDYSEVQRHMSKSFYRELSKIIQEKFDGYYGFLNGLRHFKINNKYVTIDINHQVRVYDLTSEEYIDFMMAYGI